MFSFDFVSNSRLPAWLAPNKIHALVNVSNLRLAELLRLKAPLAGFKSVGKQFSMAHFTNEKPE